MSKEIVTWKTMVLILYFSLQTAYMVLREEGMVIQSIIPCIRPQRCTQSSLPFPLSIQNANATLRICGGTSTSILQGVRHLGLLKLILQEPVLGFAGLSDIDLGFDRNSQSFL